MKHFRIIAMASVAVISVNVGQAYAEQGFTSHHLVEEKSYENFAERLPGEEKVELREYLDYETREPCQFYQPIPEGFYIDGCHLKRVEPEKVVEAQPRRMPPPPRDKMPITNVINDYEIHFAFDSAAIEPAAGDTLDVVAAEINKYNPSEVTVAGHADKSGPADYNVKLSEKRADAVSEALNDRGIENRVIDEEAYGEAMPAIPTDDGVKLRENRRVVVEFRK